MEVKNGDQVVLSDASGEASIELSSNELYELEASNKLDKLIGLS